ncbi:hypothetical protein VNO77_19040 [Canavalia gladiata]|uniref:Uncharacterized protein n=1 Tax=Canavalia gladiata TaxID=3824 RepID=A0AAN9LM11_CANGL
MPTFNHLSPFSPPRKKQRLGNAPQPIRPPYGTYNNMSNTTKTNVDISCLLTVGNPGQSFKESNEAKAPHMLLFGKLIHTEQKSSIGNE